MNIDKITTLVIIIGLFVLTLCSMRYYGAEGKDLVFATITGFFGFISGGVVNLKDKKEDVKNG